MGVFEERYYRL